MNFDRAITIVNKLLAKKRPESFNSSWILKHAPRCYRFIHRNVRTETGGINWDKVTYALEWKYQRRWAPGRQKRNPVLYENPVEVETITNKYRDKLYVFIAPQDLTDRRVRDIISITLVRLAQNGNLSAKQEVMKLVTYTINDWLEKYYFLNRWQGYEEEVRADLFSGSLAVWNFRGGAAHFCPATSEPRSARRGNSVRAIFNTHRQSTFFTRGEFIEPSRTAL